MFWKKKEQTAAETSQQEKHMPAKDRVIAEVEQLVPGQALIYKLPEKHRDFASFFIIRLNPAYPGKGKKYIISLDKHLDGKPAGQESVLLETDKPAHFKSLVTDRTAEPYI